MQIYVFLFSTVNYCLKKMQKENNPKATLFYSYHFLYCEYQ